MSKITLDSVASGYNLQKVNDNFQKIEDALNNRVLWRDNVSGETNAILSDIDVNSFRLYNLPVPVNLNDAARLKDVQNGVLGISTANLISYTPPGIGSVDVSISQKLSERLSVMDYGAVGNGIANDTDAINKAFTAASAGKTVYFPTGTYLVGSAVTSLPLIAIPVGVNVLMDKGAWLKGQGTWLTNFLSPSGKNILQVNIDGNSLPSGGVKDTWNASLGSAVGISGTDSTGFTFNVEDVTIINSEIKNLQYGVLTDGAKEWKIHNCNFHELRNCATLFGAQSGRESLFCVFTSNVFDNLGDYAVSFYSTNNTTPGDNAFHSVANNVARNCQQITNGYAYGVEAGDPNFQHHISFVNNTYQCTVVGLTGGNGGITISTTSDCSVVGNNLTGNISDISNAVGINAVGFAGKEARRGLIVNNHIEKFSTSAISLHGHSNCLISDNHIIDCGYTSSGFAPIRSNNIPASNVAIINNFISISPGYTYYGAGTPAISAFGAGLSNFTIAGNIITNPNDLGILIVGTAGSPAKGFTIKNNQVNGILDATFFRREAVYVDYATDLTISDNIIMDGHKGIVTINCDGVVLARNEFKGSETITTLYDITGSSNLKIRDDILSAPVTTILTPTDRLSNTFGNNARNCVSILTESQGSTGLISSGTVISHGMFTTPTQVGLTCTSAAIASGVTVKGTSTFTITFAGGGTQNFDWLAVIR